MKIEEMFFIRDDTFSSNLVPNLEDNFDTFLLDYVDIINLTNTLDSQLL